MYSFLKIPPISIYSPPPPSPYNYNTESGLEMADGSSRCRASWVHCSNAAVFDYYWGIYGEGRVCYGNQFRSPPIKWIQSPLSARKKAFSPSPSAFSHIVIFDGKNIDVLPSLKWWFHYVYYCSLMVARVFFKSKCRTMQDFTGHFSAFNRTTMQ